MTTDLQKHINVKFFLLFVPVAYFTYLFHEFGHWSVGELLGNRMTFSLNAVSPKDGQYLQQGHNLFVSIGGPAFSIVQTTIALVIIEKFESLFAYPFAFFPMFNRYFSVLLGGFSRQDESRIAILAGTWIYLIAVVVLAILLLAVIRCSLKLKIGAKTIGYILVVSTACQLLVIATYELLGI